jgi:putative transcriptional regulator
MKESVANNVKDHRKSTGITQEDLAGAVGVSRQTIISIERGRYIPSLPLALRIAGFFGCSTDEMFFIKEGE